MSNFSSVFRAVAACVLTMVPVTPVAAQFWQCVTYARTATSVDLRGNARTWWDQAEGRYARGERPQEGAVLAFKATRAMPYGHVAVVARVVSDREVVLDHANWSRPGQVERAARAIDVSAAGDWSAVRVTYGRAMGTRVNPTSGFIYAHRPAAPVQLASLR